MLLRSARSRKAVPALLATWVSPPGEGLANQIGIQDKGKGASRKERSGRAAYRQFRGQQLRPEQSQARPPQEVIRRNNRHLLRALVDELRTKVRLGRNDAVGQAPISFEVSGDIPRTLSIAADQVAGRGGIQA